MAKPTRRVATEAGFGGGAEASGAAHKMRLRRRTALGDISSAVGNSAGGNSASIQKPQPGGRKLRKRKADGELSSTTSTQNLARDSLLADRHPGSELSSKIGRARREASAAGGLAAESKEARCSIQEKQRGPDAGREVGRDMLERLRRCNIPPAEVSKHDMEDRDDPTACAEYVMDMYRRFKELEEKFTPTVYMHTQVDINCKMRAILIDWIVEVHLKFKLADPTLYLTCHIIDRFCMLENVHRSKLQLVGVTALLIACKYEEIYPTEVRDCVYITDHAYSREEVLEMEQTILRRLKFELSVPTQWTFLVRFLKVAKATDRQHHRAQYYLERCLQEHDGLSFRPSMLAAASIFLARIPDKGLDNAWPHDLAEFCNIPREGLESCARMLIKYLHDEPVTASQRHLVAVKKKFLGERFLAVAIDDLPGLPDKPHIPDN